MFEGLKNSDSKMWWIIGGIVVVAFMFKDKIVELWNSIVAKK